MARNYKAENVDQYIADAPKPAAKKMGELREAIRQTVPEANESIAWGVPFYRQDGLLGGFSYFKDHISFGLNTYLRGSLNESDFERLKKENYKSGSKTIQIGLDQEVPAWAIEKIIKFNLKQNQQK